MGVRVTRSAQASRQGDLAHAGCFTMSLAGTEITLEARLAGD